MKPSGTIPSWWDDDRIARAVAESGGQTPCFVYDLDIVADKIALLRAALPDGLAIHYAVKANPFPAVVTAVATQVDGLDIASGGELALLQRLSLAKPVSFAGPGKRDDELSAAIAAGITINLESAGEARRALALADRLGTRPRLAVRVNPDFALKGSGMRMGGGAAPFGVDAENAASLVHLLLGAGADWRGFHIFAGSQSLDTDAIIAAQGATVALAARLAEAVGTPPPLVNLGGGFGIPYFAGENPVDIGRIGDALGKVLASRCESLSTSRFAVETGRWLIGEAGIYLTRVVDRKDSRGEVFLVTDGGLHHQLAASGNFGTVVRRNYPIAIVGPTDALAIETVNVVGCLCTPLDRLGDAVALPRADVGDVVALFMAGAYGATASPSAFLGHAPAHECVVETSSRKRH